ncbi:MAG: polyphosphate--glucose phosphotransferase [Candidatus Limnocylindrales bacterium]
MVVTNDPPAPSPSIRLRGRGLGIDIGGTGVKAGLVDLAKGELIGDRQRERTPIPSTPEAVAACVARVVARVLDGQAVRDDMPVGCGLPGVITDGHMRTAANLDASWVDRSAEQLLGTAIGRRVYAINDADAAGIAEMSHGAGRGERGTVLVLTIGTGIGTALFVDGRLVPNCELGHLELRGKDAETLVSGAARERRGIGWRKWASDFNAYVARMEAYFWPDLIILGGGVSKELPKYEKWLVSRATMRAAVHQNAAGIIGAAAAAAYGAREARRPSARRPSARRPSTGSDAPSLTG